MLLSVCWRDGERHADDLWMSGTRLKPDDGPELCELTLTTSRCTQAVGNGISNAMGTNPNHTWSHFWCQAIHQAGLI